MSQQVYLTLRRMLTVGGFRPGESVSLRSLAKRLGTSAMPVREAVNRLIAEQALQMLPNRQVIVARMTRQKFSELSRVRQLLEGVAAEAACEKLDERGLAELEERNEILLSTVAARDFVGTLEKNKDFHFKLYEAARSELLMPMIEGLWMQAGPFLHLSLSTQTSTWTGVHHAALLSGLRRRDPPAVVRAVQADIGRTADLLMGTAVFDE